MTRRERLERKVERREEWAEGRDAKATSLRKVDDHLRHDHAFNTQPGLRKAGFRWCRPSWQGDAEKLPESVRDLAGEEVDG